MSSPALPSPWQLHSDANGRPFYVNASTGESCWNLPNLPPNYGPGRGPSLQPTFADPRSTATISYPPTTPRQPAHIPSANVNYLLTSGQAPQTSQPTRQEVHLGGNPRDRAGASENLAPEYKVRKDPAKFFRVGKVFLTLHNESTNAPLGSRSEITRGYLNENIYTEISRFVVIRENTGSCAALRVLTYRGRGCAKSGVLKSDHAMIYTTPPSPEPPVPTESECALRRGEEPMQRAAFKVTPAIKGEKLDPMSRINLGKVYTIEHNVKVRGFGVIDNFPQLYYLHKAIWDRDPPSTVGLPTMPEVPEQSTTSPECRPSYRSSSHAYTVDLPSNVADSQRTLRQPYRQAGGSNTPSLSTTYQYSIVPGTSLPVGSSHGKSPLTDDQMRNTYVQQQAGHRQRQLYYRRQQQPQQVAVQDGDDEDDEDDGQNDESDDEVESEGSEEAGQDPRRRR